MAPEELSHERQLARAVLENVRDPIVVCDADGVITLFNRTMEQLLDLPAAPLPPDRWADCHDLYHSDGTPISLVETPLNRALSGENVCNLDLILAPKDGAPHTMIANAVGLVDAEGRRLGAVLVLHDVTAPRDAQAELARGAIHDVLTGLPNRALFVDRARRALQRGRRHTSSTAVLAIGIDRLGDINESLGYDAGDRLLVEVARRLEHTLRSYDSVSRLSNTAARLGGDEFLLLCEQVVDQRAVSAIADRVAATLAEPIDVGAEPVRVSVTIGMTLSRSNNLDPDDLIIEAATAMRRGKRRGPGHREHFAEKMRAQLSTRVHDERALRQALDRGELRLAYQPKISLDSVRIVGVEALVRWEHPERGLVPPMDFIPLAEETGLIVPIGAWVLEEACREARRWRARFPDHPPLMVSVNVSGRQFEPALVDVVSSAISSAGIDASTLCLELTESTVMSDVDAAIDILRQLKALGVKISIDDFGTGYSSLAYLKRFPLDELKVDKSFIDGLGRDPEATAIVAAVVAAAQALDLTVVAEGVETGEQVGRLRTLGCEEAQGFYYFRPQPASAVGDLLAREAAAGLARRRERAAASPSDGGYGGETVVLVDDADDVRQLARVSLAAAGFEVHEASSGADAIPLVRRVRPDCVVLDVNMPGMSGFDVCRTLRADPLTGDTTIMMLTADADAADKVEAFSLEADDYIVKPFAPRDLVTRVRSAMRRRREMTAESG